MEDGSYDFIREMDDYEIKDLILNIFNVGRMSVLEEMTEKQAIEENSDFDPEGFLADYVSQYYWN